MDGLAVVLLIEEDVQGIWMARSWTVSIYKFVGPRGPLTCYTDQVINPR